MTTLPLSELHRALPQLADSHHKALSIAAKRQPPPTIRNAHSPGMTKLWSLPDPTGRNLHILQGDADGDKRLLQRVAQRRKIAPSWVVPKSVTVGDEAVIYIGGHGLFATGRVRSRPTSERTVFNRYKYRADLESVTLIDPPISLAAIRRRVPNLGWAKYPRGITTPSPGMANRIRALIGKRREAGIDIDEEDIPSANIDELRKLALLRASRSATKRESKRVYRLASKAIHSYVLHRANGHCEACMAAAPFRDPDGSPFLETHHTKRLADAGPDHPAKVIGLCPNCHRRAHLSEDAESFNASLVRKLPKLELASKNT